MSALLSARRVVRASATALALLTVAAWEPNAAGDEHDGVYWHPAWKSFTAVEYRTTGVSLVLAVAGGYVLPKPTSSRWTSSDRFDEGARDWLGASSPSGQRAAQPVHLRRHHAR